MANYKATKNTVREKAQVAMPETTTVEMERLLWVGVEKKNSKLTSQLGSLRTHSNSGYKRAELSYHFCLLS